MVETLIRIISAGLFTVSAAMPQGMPGGSCMQHRFMLVCAGMLLSAHALAQGILVQGLQFPQRLIATPAGNLLVTEGGTATPHTGRLSVVNRQGVRTSLIEGLPAARGHGIMAFGPTGLALTGRTVYLLLGFGDVLAGPPFVLNPSGPSSPIFNSVLRIEFSADVDSIRSPFRMTAPDQWVLNDGYDLALQNANGDRADVHLLTIFPSVVPNVLGGNAAYRYSDLYDAWLDVPNDALYIVDTGAETLLRVNTRTGRSMVITRFQPYERATSSGKQYVDNVPTAGCAVGDTIFVSFLSAAPFPVGEASVTAWHPSNGVWYRPVPISGDLSMVNHITCLRGSTPTVPRLVVVELSANSAISTLGVNPPMGRVQIIEGSQKRTIAESLPGPAAATVDPLTDELFVLTLTGNIVRFSLR